MLSHYSGSSHTQVVILRPWILAPENPPPLDLDRPGQYQNPSKATSTNGQRYLKTTYSTHTTGFSQPTGLESNMSHVTFRFFLSFDKVAELVGGGSVINGAYPI